MSSLKDRSVVQSNCRGVLVRKLVALAIVATSVLGLVLIGLAETPASSADTDLPHDEVTGGSYKAGSSSASA